MKIKSIYLREPRYDYSHEQCGENLEPVLYAISSDIFDVFYLCKKCNIVIINKYSNGIIDYIKKFGLTDMEQERCIGQKYIMKK